jgi:hypothetical protein
MGADQVYIVGLNNSVELLTTQWWLGYLNGHRGTTNTGGNNNGPKLYCN